jgi:cleavage and polyadenylation specificity factor subunit 2
MSNSIQFTPLSGSQDEGPLCYLLEIDDIRILLDCGWDVEFNPDRLHNLKRYQIESNVRIARDIDVVLLSHADLAHIGAYPYASAKLGLSAPVYCTLPVQNMGRVCLLDSLASKCNEEKFDLFSYTDVNGAFDRINSLRFSQITALSGNAIG